jgi:hypothetical protein
MMRTCTHAAQKPLYRIMLAQVAGTFTPQAKCQRHYQIKRSRFYIYHLSFIGYVETQQR